MTDRAPPVVFIVLFMFGMTMFTGAMLGSVIMHKSWESHLRDRGLMEHNQQTGNLEWKIGAVVTEPK